MPLKSFLAIQCIVSLLLLGCSGGPAANSPGADTVEVSSTTPKPSDKGAASSEGADSAASKTGDGETQSDDKSLWRHENSLTVPPKAREQNDATEMVRAWVVDQQLVCSLRPEIWEDPGTWGVLLADVAYQIANANGELRGIPARKTLADIASTFNAEMPKPNTDDTDKTTGEKAAGERADEPKANADKADETSEADEAKANVNAKPTTKDKPAQESASKKPDNAEDAAGK